METTTLSTKGQVILPKSVRTAHDWQPGTEFAVEEVEGGVLLRPLKVFRQTKLKEVFGCLQPSGPAKTPAEMEQGIAAGVRERHGRGRY